MLATAEEMSRLRQVRGWTALSMITVLTVAVAFDYFLPRSFSPPIESSATAAASAGINSVEKFLPTVPNSGRPTSQAPEGMVWIPGGEFSMGAQDPPLMDAVGMQATRDSRP